MTGSSLSNWDGSLTAQERTDADHSPSKGPKNTNAALQHGSFSRFHTPHKGVYGPFGAVNSVLRAVSVSGISEARVASPCIMLISYVASRCNQKKLSTALPILREVH